MAEKRWRVPRRDRISSSQPDEASKLRLPGSRLLATECGCREVHVSLDSVEGREALRIIERAPCSSGSRRTQIFYTDRSLMSFPRERSGKLSGIRVPVSNSRPCPSFSGLNHD